MERKANYAAVGTFVLLVIGLAFGFVYWYSEGRDRRNYERYEIYFTGSVSGLSEGSSVRYLGVVVGRVARIGIDPRDPGRVRVVADVGESTPVTADTVARLTLQGVTGLLFVDPAAADLHDSLNTVDTPLNKLTDADLVPSLAALEKINAGLR